MSTKTPYTEKAIKRVIESYRELPEAAQEKILDQIKYDGVLQAVAEIDKTRTVAYGELFGLAEERQQFFNKPEGFMCGLRYFDDAIMGFRPGEVIIIAGPSNVGKTGVALNVVTNMLMKSMKRVLIISMEMTPLEIASRIYNIVGKDNHNDFIMENLLIQTQLSVSAKHIEAMIDQLKPDLVMIDHLQFLANQEQGQEYERVSAAIAKVKRLAITKKMPIITISHVSKARSGNNGEATASDLKGASNIEQDADVGIMLNRLPEDRDRLMATLFKHRTKRPDIFHEDCLIYFSGIRVDRNGTYTRKNQEEMESEDDEDEIRLADLPF